MFAYGRNIYSLSRAGYFPHFLSVTLGERKTPHIALISGSAVGFMLLMVLYFVDPNGSGAFGGVILNMAVFGAVIAYIMQMIAYLILKNIPRAEHPRTRYEIVAGSGTAFKSIIQASSLPLGLKPHHTMTDPSSEISVAIADYRHSEHLSL